MLPTYFDQSYIVQHKKSSFRSARCIKLSCKTLAASLLTVVEMNVSNKTLRRFALSQATNHCHLLRTSFVLSTTLGSIEDPEELHDKVIGRNYVKLQVTKTRMPFALSGKSPNMD